jgi:hypothetical protein
MIEKCSLKTKLKSVVSDETGVVCIYITDSAQPDDQQIRSEYVMHINEIINNQIITPTSVTI